MNQEMSFIMHTPEGDVTMNVLFTFESPETKAFYMLYTPDPLDSPTPVRLSACRFDPEDPTKILPLQGENDRKIVQQLRLHPYPRGDRGSSTSCLMDN